MYNPLKSPARFPLLFLITAFVFVACHRDDFTPKPRGYFRIALPEKNYRLLDSIYPYKFEFPEYAIITPDAQALKETNWINIDFKSFRGKVHMSYKKIENPGNLNIYAEDARTLALKHIPKASSIEQQLISYPEHKVYGLIYNIRGLGAASPYQFYVTDSVHHFVRGALYFDAVPNSDSLMPVIDFVKKDIDHLVQTLEWK
ncbi:MAG: gliding motility lipoprotein GldD [Bacteroidales bacterium]|nr:gliding motility lipoprotein GldD [Bacteroidales bacterium]